MRCWLAGLVAAAALAAGCDATPSRTYAVTLQDSPSLDCYGYAWGLLADPEQLAETAKQLRGEWKVAHQASPPRPQPRVLRINELETRLQAWFDPADDSSQQVPLGDAGAAPDGGADAGAAADAGATADAGAPLIPADEIGAAPYRYDDPDVVYEGELHDDYIEGSYAELLNTDAADEELGLYPCGPRARAYGILSITEDGGALGRIRWTHIRYVGSEFSACEGRIECVRSIAIEGLAVE